MNEDTADDLIASGMQDRAEEEGLFAIAYALTRLNATFQVYVTNIAQQHANETWTAKASSEALARLAISAEELTPYLKARLALTPHEIAYGLP